MAKKDNFDQLIAEMAANAKGYEAKTIRFLDYSAKKDAILEAYGWTHKEFCLEILKRGQSGVPGVRRG
jgi:hypothetical protein